MTSRDFCYWLQGYFEIGSGKPGVQSDFGNGLTYDQIELIRRHLALVFKHEIDPSMGPQTHQDELNKIHNRPPKLGEGIARC